MSKKPKVATVWLDGCSGCHMSFLDMDERLIDLAEKVDVVHSPIVDPKDFPEDVDVTLVEGAVSSEEDLHKILTIRERTKILISMGDCAVAGNVPSMRNLFKVDELMDRAYVDTATIPATRLPSRYVPALRVTARPIHDYVDVDVFLQGCPPPADAIHYLITELLEGRKPDLTKITRFGK